MKQVTHNVYGFKPTDETWYGNFQLNCNMYRDVLLVRVSKTWYDDDSMLVSVWGNDDFGLERSSHNNDGTREWSNDAQNSLFNVLMSSDSISKIRCLDVFGMVHV